MYRKWAAGLAVLALAASLTGCKDEDKRCVDEKTHKVVSSDHCEKAENSDDGVPLGAFLWYVGGRGTRVGDTVRGGSYHSLTRRNSRRNNGKNNRNSGGKNGGGGRK